MTLRKSRRAKAPKKVVEIDPDVFEDEDDIQAGPSGGVLDEDEDFKLPPSPGADEAQDEDIIDEDDDAMDVDVAEASAESDFEAKNNKSPKKVRKTKVATKVTAEPKQESGYLDINTARGAVFVQGYNGAYDRSVKGKAIIRIWYPHGLGTVKQMLARWYDFPVLPPKMSDLGKEEELGLGIWTPGRIEKEKASTDVWYGRMKAASPGSGTRVLSIDEAQPYRDLSTAGSMPIVIGPADAQTELQLKAGDSVCLASSGAPADDDEPSSTANAGWLLDAGGIVTSLSWKPNADTTDTEQILALAVTPHVDQTVAEYEKESQNPDFQRYGTVQIWSLSGAEGEDGFVRASRDPARCLRILSIDKGRAKRVQWSHTCGLLAILCGDGSVCVVEPEKGGNGDYEMIENPIATLSLGTESTKATSMTWNSCNRLSVGYSDGSIALWSIFPKRLLSRHPIHHNHVLDIASAYPTFPYLVSSTPVGGPTKLVDLRAPGNDTTESITPSVTTHSELLAYSEHLLGFYFPLPSSNAQNTVIGFAHHAYYPMSRRVSTPDSFVTCLSAGRTHPYLLIGTLDGCLLSLNPQAELFATRYEISDRIRVYQHEYRSSKLYAAGAAGSERGASRLLQGFSKEKNPNPRTEYHKAIAANKNAKKGKGKAGEAPAAVEIAKQVIHEPLTRITCVQWNPNAGYGCWAAAATGSGLVRIMDLGLEPEAPKD